MRTTSSHSAVRSALALLLTISAVLATALPIVGRARAAQPGALPAAHPAHNDGRVLQLDAADRLAAVMEAATAPGLDAVSVLSQAAMDADPWVQSTAIVALGERSANAQERQAAAQGLQSPLGSADPRAREMAAVAAGRLGAVELVELLLPLAADPEPRVVSQALAALAALRDVRGIPAATQALALADEGVRQRALLTLATLGSGAATSPAAQGTGTALPYDPTVLARELDRAVGAVTELAHDPGASTVVRQHAVLTLGALAAPSARAALDAIANGADPLLAAQARLALARSGIPPRMPNAQEEQP
jgi:HEAT repeat protein